MVCGSQLWIPVAKGLIEGFAHDMHLGIESTEGLVSTFEHCLQNARLTAVPSDRQLARPPFLPRTCGGES